MAKDLLAEAIVFYKEIQDDLTEMSAEIDMLLEERLVHPCLGSILEGQSFLSDRYDFVESTIAQLLAGAPVLLRSI